MDEVHSYSHFPTPWPGIKNSGIILEVQLSADNGNSVMVKIVTLNFRSIICTIKNQNVGRRKSYTHLSQIKLARKLRET